MKINKILDNIKSFDVNICFPFSSKSNPSIWCYDKWMRYIPQKDLSLRKLSMAKIISTFWKNGRLNDDLHRVVRSTADPAEKRSTLIGKAKLLFMELEIPAILMEELLILLEWVTYDYLFYVEELMSNEFYSYRGNIHAIVNKIEWNMHGSVDEVETFKSMRYSNAHYNYVKSLFYCLEEDIPLLWSRLSPVYKPKFSIKKIYSQGFESYASFIIYYWTCRVKGREFRIDSLEDPIGLFDTIANCSVDLKMLKISLYLFNVHSFKYFWHKLEGEERMKAITLFSDNYALDDLSELNHYYDTIKNNAEIIIFALSQMDDEERSMVIRRCFSQIILLFWQYWQMHHAILPLFESYVEFLDDYTYKNLFNNLIEYTNEYAPKGKVLYLMWQASPPRLQCLLDEEKKHLILMGNSGQKYRYDNS